MPWGREWANSWTAAAATGRRRSKVMSTPSTPRQPSVPKAIGLASRASGADAMDGGSRILQFCALTTPLGP